MPPTKFRRRFHLLWYPQWLFWQARPLWPIGNGISRFRNWLYRSFGWEWV